MFIIITELQHLQIITRTGAHAELYPDLWAGTAFSFYDTLCFWAEILDIFMLCFNFLSHGHHVLHT